MSEEQEQIALFKWAKLQENVYPELRLLFHVPNGGKRSKVTAAHMKAAGAKAGVPDVCLPVPRGRLHGLYIEMKYGNNKPSPDQIQWLIDLAAMGYKTAVCYSMEEARAEIMAYLNGVKHE